MIRPVSLFYLLAALCLAAPAIFAQTPGGLRGQVLDPSGAAVPGAKITITASTGAAKVAESDESGVYSVTGLMPDDYTLRTTAVGFGVLENKASVRSGQITTLDLSLAVVLERQQITVAEQTRVDVDPSNNASALVLKGDDLNTLSDNPGDLASDLQALAGPAAGPNGGQIFVDGFSNGQLPPKESIREIRLNSNPFSAEFDRQGMGRVEIFTRPGTDKLRGNVFTTFMDSALNARNPFSPTKPPTQQRMFQGNLGGPLTKKASFTVDAIHSKNDSSALINAQILDTSLQPVDFRENLLTPSSYSFVSPRIDYALNPNTTLQGRYSYNRNRNENGGIGQFSLASRATDSTNENQTAQFTMTQVIGTRLINETRFQFNNNRNEIAGDGRSPSINVLSSFNGGGAAIFDNYNDGKSFEVQNNSSYARGRHVARFGIRIRRSLLDSFVTSNYNGTYTFTSIESYATTLRGIAQGLTFEQIRAQGGGARQYSVSGGTPLTNVSLTDAAPFIQDDWKLKPNLTLSLGLRYEIQSNISNRDAWAPRIGVAWGVGKGQGAGRAPKTVLRLGTGIFYERVNQNLTLQTLRQNGTVQQNFFIDAPNFYPTAPSVTELAANRLPQAIYQMDSRIVAPRLYQSALTVEQQLPKNMTASVTYTNTRGVHQLRSRNINAPLPGSFTGPGTGTYPLGTSGQLFLYESSATYRQHQVITLINARINPKYSLFGYYAYNRAFSNADGAGSFPANNYDVSGEWGRSGNDFRHLAQIGGTITLPFKFQYSPNINLRSSQPVNITTGTDLNGDTNFNDRPAFATVPADPSRGIIGSRWGVFNIDPIGHPEYGSVIIPRNYGTAYGFFGIFSRLTRTWTFGESAAPNRPPNAAASNARTPAPPGRYSVQLLITVGNTLNKVNPAPPVSNMSSPFFSQKLQSTYGGNANRFVNIGARFAF